MVNDIRLQRLSEVVKQRASQAILYELKDPRMGFVTITRIELTDDLRYAKVFYSVLGSVESKESTQAALEENRGLIKRLAVERVNMKYAMELKFEPDRSIDEGFKIDQILKKIKGKET